MMYLFGPAVCNWILCSTKQNLFHFSFLIFFPLFFTQKRITKKETTQYPPFLSSFLKLNYRGEKKKISDFSNDDRPRLFLFELLFFFAEEKKEKLAH